MNADDWADFQPIVIGLGAVVLGTLGNTLLEWYKHALSNRHAAATLRRALAEELRIWRDGAASNQYRADDQDEEGHRLIPIVERYPIYEENIGRLGLLSSNEVAAVVYAYAILKVQVETYAILGRIERVEGVVLRAIIPAKWRAVLGQANADLIKALDTAIEALSRN